MSFNFSLCYTVRQARYPNCVQYPVVRCTTTLHVSKFQEKGFLEKDRLIIEVYMKIVEAGDVLKETVDIIASQLDYASQASLIGIGSISLSVFEEITCFIRLRL